MPVTGTVIPFPPWLRVVKATADALSQEDATLVLVEHGGRAYLLANLMARLSPAKQEQIKATVPRSGQAAWDEVVRRWPALADLIVAGCRAVG